MDLLLLKAKLKTDRRVQTAVYEAHCRKVYHSCHRVLRDQHMAEDLMQEAFIQAFAQIDRFRGDAELSTWICRIAINKCLDYLKKKRVKLDYDYEWERKAADQTAIDQMEPTYDAERIALAVKDLPEGCRIIFTLHLFEEIEP